MGPFRQNLIAVLFLAAMLMPARTAYTQTQQQVDWCTGEGNPPPDLKIGACTAVIQSGTRSGKSLVFAFNNRGNAYKNKGQYDRAIQDYDEVIRLDPNQAVTFFNRCLARA